MRVFIVSSPNSFATISVKAREKDSRVPCVARRIATRREQEGSAWRFDPVPSRQWRKADFPNPAGRPIMVLDFDDIALRLSAAAAMGMLIGINRDLQNKPIGARTLGLVGLGTATVAVAGIQYPGMAENPDAASRVVQGIIQGVMTGISFVGAGVILRDAKTRMVEGLTTAATVWVTAALGIACGLAAWRSVAIAMPVALVLLVVVPWIENAFSKEKKLLE
jgi:putative Mg2+ transporter-C (MgtC) family protein